MNVIHLRDITIKPERQRQEFEPNALQELKNSIEERGLLHPPVLRQEADAWVLVAGERRLKAISEIFELGGQFTCDGEVYCAGIVPFTNLGNLSVLDAEEAELDENLRRKDLTWQEHAAAVARLNALRTSQKQAAFAEAVEQGVAGELLPLPHTIADTAEELTGHRHGSYQDTIRREIIVARHLDNPVIAKAKSADEAYKLLKREEERQRNLDRAAEVGATFNSDIHECFNVDCLEWMAAHTGQFDVILTDPPYGMNAQDFGDGAGRLSGIEHHYDDSYESWVKLLKAWATASYLVAKPQAHAYVFCDFDRFHELKGFMQEAGWYVFRTPLINYKTNSGRVPLPDQGPRRQYEIVLYAIKGKKPVTHIYPDVITSGADENMSHGAQKPVAVYQNLLQRSVRAGDLVLDCFAGSGTIFPAADSFHCKAVGLEKNPEYFSMCIKRLEQLKREEQLGFDL